MKDDIIEILEKYELVNPKLICDGHGEYADVYAIGRANAIDIAEQLEIALNHKPKTD